MPAQDSIIHITDRMMKSGDNLPPGNMSSKGPLFSAATATGSLHSATFFVSGVMSIICSSFGTALIT